MNLEPRRSALDRLRHRAELALYRALRPARQRTMGLRTTAVALVVAVGFASVGGYLLGDTDPITSSGALEASARESYDPDIGGRAEQDAVLGSYFDKMDTLLMDEGLRSARGRSDVRMMARTRTLTALEGLEPPGKTQVVRFLSSEASLVQSAPGQDPVVSLMSADLRGIDLSQDAPGGAEPHAAVPLYDLSRSDLTYANLNDADLSGIIMHGTRLVGADLRDADLSGTVLYGANLSGANLSGVTGKTAEQLERESSSLDGAVMPDGQKYKG